MAEMMPWICLVHDIVTPLRSPETRVRDTRQQTIAFTMLHKVRMVLGEDCRVLLRMM